MLKCKLKWDFTRNKKQKNSMGTDSFADFQQKKVVILVTADFFHFLFFKQVWLKNQNVRVRFEEMGVYVLVYLRFPYCSHYAVNVKCIEPNVFLLQK